MEVSMSRSKLILATVQFAVVIAMATSAMAQLPIQGAPGPAQRGARPAGRPGLFFSEVWQQTPEGGEHPVTQQSIANPDLELKLYGPTSAELQINGADGNAANPIHIWSGLCTTGCALAFRHNTSNVDLSGLARIRWNTKMSGFHQIRPIVKLADGTWLIGDPASGSPSDYLVDDIPVAELRWLELDIDRIVTVGLWVNDPDLTNVEEVGFADLTPGSGHGAGGWVDVAEIEVYGVPVER
jgi:hypothetical protein